MPRGNVKDLSGMTFGRLKVIDRAPNSKSGHVRWNCICNCGTSGIRIVDANSLKNGHSKSCGCLKVESSIKNLEKTRETNARYNRYELKDDHYVGYCHQGREFYFSIEDYDKIKDYYWQVQKSGYVRGVKATDKSLHRFIMDAKAGEIVDHIDRNPSNNRRNNLRIVTQFENGVSKSKLRSNTTGVTGIYWIAKRNYWVASIRRNGKSIFLGEFFNKENAIVARREGEEIYFGAYRPSRDGEPDVCVKPLSDLHQSIAETVRFHREKLGMTKIEYAEHMGMTFPRVNQLEFADNNIPLNELLELCDKIGCKPTLSFSFPEEATT